MDRSERRVDPEEILRNALDGLQARLWTCFPGIVSSDYDVATGTVGVDTAVKLDINGGFPSQQPSMILCPVLFPSGGGYTLTYPIKAGDECLVFVANRCVDAWWENGAQDGGQEQLEMRMNDLSDCFVMVGPRSKPKVVPSVSTTNVQLRTDAGTDFVEIDKAAHLVRIVSVTKVRVESQDIELAASRDIKLTAGRDIILAATARRVDTAGTTASYTAAASLALQAPAVTIAGTLSYSSIGGGAGTMTIDGNIVQTGNFANTGALTNNGQNVGNSHAHSGVQTGGGNTGPVV